MDAPSAIIHIWDLQVIHIVANLWSNKWQVTVLTFQQD
jgi:hypothetical protein